MCVCGAFEEIYGSANVQGACAVFGYSLCVQCAGAV